jgi:CIC family chloride channel protein
VDHPIRDALGGAGRRHAAELGRRFHLTLVLAVVIGVLTGVAVAGFDTAVSHTLDLLLDQPPFVIALVPALGLVAVNMLNSMWGDGDTTTTDAYVRAYHQRDGRLPLRVLGRKITASALTLASGNAFGFEGPSMLIGGTIGSTVEERFASRNRRDDAKVLMVAGAAAGVAAVFKAPLTGVIFALEVPYRSDLARRALLPSLVAAGSAYVTYVLIVGTTPLLSTGGAAPFDLRDLGGGLVLGLICGVLARLGAFAIGQAKRLVFPPVARVAITATAIVALAPIAQWWFGAPLHLGPGYKAIEWAADPDRTLLVLVGLFAVRALSTWLGVAGRGLGGLFIPLVTQGAIVGSVFQHVVHAPNAYLFPTIGIAAFLGAGYRTPLAGVAFVAEATGQPGFLVPALLAAAVAQLTMGRHSFSSYQRNERLPDIEPLTRIPVAEVMSSNADTIDASLTLDKVVTSMLSQNRRWAPVVDDMNYIGLLAVTDIANIPANNWPEVTARQIAQTHLLPAAPNDSVSLVADRLRSSNSEAIAVTEHGQVIGVVTLRDLSNIEVLLDRLNNEAN